MIQKVKIDNNGKLIDTMLNLPLLAISQVWSKFEWISAIKAGKQFAKSF